MDAEIGMQTLSQSIIWRVSSLYIIELGSTDGIGRLVRNLSAVAANWSMVMGCGDLMKVPSLEVAAGEVSSR